MKILDKYILKFYLTRFLGVFAICFLIFIIQTFWLYIDELAGKGLDIITIGKFFIYFSPKLVPLVLPLSILLASLITYGTLSENYEFIAMKSCIEEVRGLRYKLCILGVPIYDEGPTHIFCDNQSVLNNCSKIESVLNKKHSSIAYHMARWAVAAGEICVGWINREYNLADAFTHRLSKACRERLFWNWTY